MPGLGLSIRQVAERRRPLVALPDVVWNNTINFVHTGNSFVAGDGSTGGQSFPVQLQALPPFAGSGATGKIIGHGGYNWSQLNDAASGAGDVDASFVAGKYNILLVGETTNSIFNSGLTAAQTIAQAKAYVSARLAAHPWDRIVIYGTIPREDTNNAGAPNQVDYNNRMVAVDADMAANPSSYGVYGFIDVRAGTIWQFPNYADASFEAVATYWDGAGPGKRVHPSNAGYGVLAQSVSAYLRKMPIGAAVPAPSITKPTISPTSGTVGTTFTATDGTPSNGTFSGRRWFLGGAAIGTGTTVTPAAAGTLVLENTVTAPNGVTATATSDPVTVGAAATAIDPLTSNTMTYGAGDGHQARTAGKAVVPATVLPVNPTKPITITARVKPTSTALQVVAAQQNGWYLGTSNGHVYASSGNNSFSSDIEGSTNVNDGGFHTIAIELRTTGSFLYVDGVAEAPNGGPRQPSNSSPSTSGNPMEIGTLNGGYNFAGVFQDVRIYNGLLYSGTATRIANYPLDGNGNGTT